MPLLIFQVNNLNLRPGGMSLFIISIRWEVTFRPWDLWVADLLLV